MLQISESDCESWNDFNHEQKTRALVAGALSLSRIAIGAVVLGRAIKSKPASWVDAGLIAAGAATDALDGRIAKAQNVTTGNDAVTEFGATLDPACDKVFMGFAELAAVVRERPRKRDLAKYAIRAARDFYTSHVRTEITNASDGRVSVKAGPAGKANTVLRMAYSVFANSPAGQNHPGLREEIDTAVTATTVLSGAELVHRLHHNEELFENNRAFAAHLEEISRPVED